MNFRRRRAVLKADRLLLAQLELAVPPGPEAIIMTRALQWWVDGAWIHHHAEPPGPPATSRSHRILLAYLPAHPEEVSSAALKLLGLQRPQQEESDRC